MRLLIALSPFKGTLTAPAACAAAARGLARALPDATIDQLPVADGGRGTMEIVRAARGGVLRTTMIADPLLRTIEGRWLDLGDGGALIEMAEASGLHLLADDERHPLDASSFGTGALAGAALAAGARRLLFTLGDTATVDGGLGAARALGARFFDASGAELSAHLRARDLARIARVDLTELKQRLAGVTVEALCDVTNPLLGGRGAARVFGPQKGATPAEVEQLEAGLAHAYRVITDATGIDVRAAEGAGAAGGMGACVMGLLGGTLTSGAERILAMLRFNAHLAEADAVIVGEGRFDSQSLHGKASGRVALRCRARGTLCAALVGGIAPGGDVDVESGLAFVVPARDAALGPPPNAEVAEQELEEAAARLGPLLARRLTRPEGP